MAFSATVKDELRRVTVVPDAPSFPVDVLLFETDEARIISTDLLELLKNVLMFETNWH